MQEDGVAEVPDEGVQSIEPDELPSELSVLRAKEWIRRGYLLPEVCEKLAEEFGHSTAQATECFNAALAQFANEDVDIARHRDRNLALHTDRLTMIFRHAMEEFSAESESIGGDGAGNDPVKVPRHKAPDRARFLKTALEALDRIGQVQRLVGPKNLVQVALGFGGGTTSGPQPLQPRSESELLAEARQRGLPVPVDFELQELAVEAGRKGETLLIDAMDAKRLQEGRH